jgi:hypothetical protein
MTDRDTGWPMVFRTIDRATAPAATSKRMSGRAILLALTLAFAIAGFPTTPSRARDPQGRYANSPLHDWFNQLKSGKGLCCSFADAATVEDPDWDIRDGHYRVRIDANWYDVPDDAVILEPNRFGKTMVWPAYLDGRLIEIRCFMPGDLG